MYFMTVNYPVTAGKSFNQQYYLNNHLPLVQSLFSKHGLSAMSPKLALGYAPGKPDAFYASVDLIFDSLESLKLALKAEGKKVNADVKNYTDVEPSYIFGEIAD